MVIYLNDDSTVTPININTLAEQSSATKGMVAALQSDSKTTLYNSYDAVKVFGPNPIQNKELAGSVATSPLDTSVYTVAFASNSGDATCNMLIEVEYVVEFFELKDVSSS